MIDNTIEYGLVLEGGGAKGAFQIGVWKALIENNIKIKAIAGVSVGGLNAALIAMGDYELALNLWKSIRYSSIIDVDDKNMDNVIKGNVRQIDFQHLKEDGKKLLIDKGFDVLPLKQLIKKNIDEDKIRKSGIDLILNTFSLTDFKEIELSLNEIEEGKLGDFLMASASFPLFKREKLDGKTYIDGGISNNLPMDLLIKRGYKNIIVVRIYGIGIEKRIRVPEDVNIIEIYPEVDDLGYVLQFDKKTVIRNIKKGYYEGHRVLRSLKGKFYFIEDINLDEMWFFKKLINISDESYMQIAKFYKLDYLGKSKIRMLTQEIYPKVAPSLKLKKDWTYKDLYIVILEALARKFRIKRYNIYTKESLLEEIRLNYKIEKDEFDLILEIGKHLI